jgi:hypothetical protein
MSEKQRGIADVTVSMWAADAEAVKRLWDRFAQQARTNGTLELDEPITREANTGLYVWLNYRHTAKNQGNHEWDARRFLDRAVDGEESRYHLYRIKLNSWKPIG